MNQKWESTGDYSVEIWFRIERDAQGYPESKNWEQVLAHPVVERDDYFQIVSIPFYLKNVSCGDIVKANVVENKEIQEGEIFEFDRVVDHGGGHNTYRLFLKKKHPDDPVFTTDELLKKGMAVEEQYGDFFAIDVPPTLDQQAIDIYLQAECDAGRWEMQEGCLHTIRRL